MKYTLELLSPDYPVLQRAIRSQIITQSAYAHTQATLYGRTSKQHRDASELLRALQRVEGALKIAEDTASPERAIQSTETPARNAGDEMRVVYGRPRNDPRDARTGEKRQPRK